MSRFMLARVFRMHTYAQDRGGESFAFGTVFAWISDDLLNRVN